VTDAPPSVRPTGAPRVGPYPAPRRRLGSKARSALEWILIIVGALLVAFVVKTFLIQAFYIPSGSMEPQLKINDRVLVNKLSYRLHDINRGDIVVFERPSCNDGEPPVVKDLIKRVIAVSGETVEGRDGRVLVDGRPIDEPYLPAGVVTGDFEPVTVPAGTIWVMGDNRNNSRDSRVLCGGPTFIPEESIIGRAFVRIFPPNAIGLL
jgi:signal peptidase I